jgi:hypothetical protein
LFKELKKEVYLHKLYVKIRYRKLVVFSRGRKRLNVIISRMKKPTSRISYSQSKTIIIMAQLISLKKCTIYTPNYIKIKI